MKEIISNKGRIALVDDDDYERLNGYKWYNSTDGYIQRSIKKSNEKWMIWMIHWDVIGKPIDGQQVDHRDGNKLNNCRSNLRICSNAENGMNRGMNKNNSTGYKGVKWNNASNKWIALIRTNGKQMYLGSFNDKIDAALAYNDGAKKYHGEFAQLNNVERKLKE